MTRPLPLGIAGLVLLAATVGLSQVPSSVPVGPDRIPALTEEGWRFRGDNGGVAEQLDGTAHLVSAQGQRAVALYDLTLPDDRFRWRVTAHIKAPRPAEVKVMLAGSDGDRRLWVGSYRVESDDWTDVVLPVTADLRGLDVTVGIRMRGEAGEAWVDRVDLEPMEGRPLWTAGLGVLIVGWIGLGVLVLKHTGPAVFTLVSALGVGVTFPRTWMDMLLGPLASIRVWDAPIALFGQKILGHAGLFAALGLLLAPKVGPWRALAGLAALGVITETLQLVSVARSASVVDVGLDLMGGVVGIGLAMAWMRWRRS